MMYSEFTALTGHHPCWAQWEEINRVYNASQLDKHEWCKAYCEDREGMASKIAHLTDHTLDERFNKQEAELRTAQTLIAQLTQKLNIAQEQLDRELQWHPAKDIGTNLSEEEYAILARDGTELNDLDAIRRVYEECGFDMARIHIVEKVCSYEANKHRKCRVSGEYSRRPFWGSTDWNYIRFDVGNFQWELVNGELMPYCD